MTERDRHLAADLRRELARRPRQHSARWADMPCSCGVCRADRFVNRVAGILVGVVIGYLGAHLVVGLLTAASR